MLTDWALHRVRENIETFMSQESLIGKLIGARYKVTRMLGEGGMGCVYEAEQQLGTTIRKVAVKTLHPHLSQDPKIQARFMREVGTIADLHHPNTIQVYDFGTTDDGQLYIAMEFVEGKSIGEILEKTGPLEPARVENILKQVVGSLEEAHGQGIVHRDLKPENVILTDKAGKKDWVEVLDFGIAKRSSEEDPNEQKLTQQGMVLGTPPYMSPEQFTGRPIDVRSDIYALGVMTYEMLTGQLPFEAQTAWEWATQHMTAQPKPIEVQPGGDQIPPKMRTAIMRSLAKDPNDRFASVTEFFDAFAMGLAPSGRVNTASLDPKPSVRQSSGTQVGEPIDGAMLGGGAAMGYDAGGYQPPGPNPGQAPAYVGQQGQGGYPSAQPSYQQAGYAQPPAPPSRHRGGGNKGLIVGVAAVVGALSIGAGVFALKGKSRPPVTLDFPTNAMTSTSGGAPESPTGGTDGTSPQAGGSIPSLNDGKRPHVATNGPGGTPGLPASPNPTMPPGTTTTTSTTPPGTPTSQPPLPPTTTPPPPTPIPVVTAAPRNEFACSKVATARTSRERAMWIQQCNKR